MKRNYSHPARAGLTRIEVVVLIIVVSMMLAMLFPFIMTMRGHPGHSPDIQCMNNMKQLSLAMHSAMASSQGKFPPAQNINQEGQIQFGWRIALLPYMEQQGLYEHIMSHLPWDNKENRQFENMRISTLVCPGFQDLQPGQTSYQVIVGPNTPFEGDRCSTHDDFKRGLGHTILIAETSQGVKWMEPIDLPYQNLDYGIVPLSSKYWSVGSGHRRHDRGAHVAMADGSVRTLVFSQKTNDVANLQRMTWLKEPTQDHR